MENTLKKHQIQTQLNEKLRLLVEKEGLKAIGEINNLLHKGADPNFRPKFGVLNSTKKLFALFEMKFEDPGATFWMALPPPLMVD